jgi:hypothetical protein
MLVSTVNGAKPISGVKPFDEAFAIVLLFTTSQRPTCILPHYFLSVDFTNGNITDSIRETLATSFLLFLAQYVQPNSACDTWCLSSRHLTPSSNAVTMCSFRLLLILPQRARAIPRQACFPRWRWLSKSCRSRGRTHTPVSKGGTFQDVCMLE